MRPFEEIDRKLEDIKARLSKLPTREDLRRDTAQAIFVSGFVLFLIFAILTAVKALK